MHPTCSVIISGQGEPIVHCGKPARSAIYTTSPVRGVEHCDSYACGPDHLAAELRLIALYEVCDIRVDRFI